MKARIEQMPLRHLVGVSREMSLLQNKTQELWQSFMPRRNEVAGRISNEYISMQVYDTNGDTPFNPATVFQKWAVVEVGEGTEPPADMQGFTLDAGLYAVFDYEGPASGAPQVFGYIFGEWLPNSAFEIDSRPQFEVLPEGYNTADPKAQEEIWIPIREK